MKQAVLLLSEIFLSVVALSLLVGEAFWPHRRRLWMHLGIFSLVLAAAYQAAFFMNLALPWVSMIGLEPLNVVGGWVQYGLAYGMISVDSLAVFFKLAVLLAVILVLCLSYDHREFADTPMGSYTGLLLLSAVGMMLLAGAVDLLMAVVALELVSVSSFVLTGFVFQRRSSAEGAIKFLLVGAFSTALLLFGISYYYGYFGSTGIGPLLTYPSLHGAPDMALCLVVVFIIAGIGFKLAMVPFHMWAPDAYEGAPTPVTGFLSVAPKAAAIGFLLRLLGNHAGLDMTVLLSVLAVLTMTVGNVGALHQTNVKRLLAYSSIAQVGYILVAIVAGGSLGGQAAMVYTFLYIFMNLGIFAALIMVSNDGNDDITAFAGLYRKSLPLSLAVVVFLLSLTGIPPLSGFVGKFAIFASIITRPDLLWLGVAAVLNSVVSLFYYFRIVQQIFFREPDSGGSVVYSPALVSCLFVALAVTLALGILPNQILGWVRYVVGS